MIVIIRYAGNWLNAISHAILMSAKHAVTAKSSIEKKAFGNADFGNMKSVMSKIYSVV